MATLVKERERDLRNFASVSTFICDFTMGRKMNQSLTWRKARKHRKIMRLFTDTPQIQQFPEKCQQIVQSSSIALYVVLYPDVLT